MSEHNISKSSWTPKIAGFLCQWCSYAGADLAGSTRINYPSSIQIIRVPCTSRISPQLVMKALTNGLDGVLISGCHPGTCHYIDGNLRARRRFLILRRLLEFMGIAPQRLQMSWVSASEGHKWIEIVRHVTQEITALGPNTIFEDNARHE
jgi:F420-non-reducing hydrogenase iron-sulfur subunit